MGPKLHFKLFFIVSTLFIIFRATAQPFRTMNDLSKAHSDIENFSIIDFDADSILDLITFSIYDKKIAWYKGTDSLNFSTQNILIQDAYNIRNVLYNKFNGDSLTDILMSDLDSIYIFENEGNGVIQKTKTFPTIYQYRHLVGGDLDGDGDIDLIGTSYLNLGSLENIYYIENIGDSLFNTPVVIGTNYIIRQIEIVDFDQDGYNDIVVGGKKLDWFKNLGNGTFSDPNNLHSLYSGLSFFHVKVVDADMDGDLDLIASSNQSDSKFRLYTNDGDMNFNYIPLTSAGGSYTYINDINIFDVDSDGLLDIIYSVGYGSSYWKKKIDTNLYDNNNYDLFSERSLQTVIKDINADGIDEIAFHNSVGLYIKNVDYDTTLVIKPIWSVNDQEVQLGNSKYLDVDGDGLLDLISLENHVFWRKNLGNNIFDKEIVINKRNIFAVATVGDMDNDGDLDFIQAFPAFQLAFGVFENVNNTDSTILHIIDSSDVVPYQEMEVGDIDGDGYLDVVSFSQYSNYPNNYQLIWYKNLGNFTFSSKHIITSNLTDAHDLILFDLDNDGDLDVLTTSKGDGKLAWHKNLGNGTISSTQNIISNNASLNSFLECGDFDNDGDNDIISRIGLNIYLLKNNGNQNFSSQVITNNGIHKYHFYKSKDIDEDGFLDLVFTEDNPEKVYWLKNLSGTGFSNPFYLHISSDLNSSYGRNSAIFFEDDGNDGDIDIFVGNGPANRFAKFENLRNSHSDLDTLTCDSFMVPSLSVVLYNSQNYIDTLTNSTGGDSIINIQLTINESTLEVINEHICLGDSFFYQGLYYYSNIQDIDTFQNICFQDSIIKFNLWVHNEITSIDTALCEGESINIANINYSSSGYYIDTLQNIYSCDSIIELNLIINPQSYTNLDTTSCTSFNVGSTTYFTSGVYVDTLLNRFHCDSIIILELTINNDYEIIIDSTICEGTGVTIGDSYYKYSGNYTDTLNSIESCDSIINLNLMVLSNDSTAIDTILCFGEFFQVGDSNYYTSGFYVDSFFNQCNLDSVVYLELTVNPTNELQIDTSICNGNVIMINNLSYDQSGSYTISLTNQYNCDSIIYLELDVYPSNIVYIDTFLCNNDELRVGDSIYKSSGIYSNEFIDHYGCDSIVISTIEMINLMVSNNNGILSGNQPNAEYQWLSCPHHLLIENETLQDFIPINNGSYSVEISFNGCIDTTECIDMYNVNIEEYSIWEGINYTNPFDNSITLELPNYNEIYQLTLNDSEGKIIYSKRTGIKLYEIIQTAHLPSGIYYISLIDKKGINTKKIIKL